MSGRTQAVYYRDAHGLEPVWQFVRELAATSPSAAAKIYEFIDEHLNDRPASHRRPGSRSAPRSMANSVSYASGSVVDEELLICFQSTVGGEVERDFAAIA